MQVPRTFSHVVVVTRRLLRFYRRSRACIQSRAAVKLDELHAPSRHAAQFRMDRKAIWSDWADASNMRRASQMNWLTKK